MGKKRAFLAVTLIAFTGCQYLPWGKKAAEPIFIGEPETIIVEPPDDASSLSYNWQILEVPDESLLIPEFSATSNVFTFTADVEGEYTFSAIVNSRGEEVADHVFRYIAIEDTSVVPKQAEPMASSPLVPVPTAPITAPVNMAAQSLQRQLDAAETKVSPPSRKTAVVAKRKAKSRPKMRKVPADVVAGHYTIQVSSWNTAKKAQKVKLSLDGLGYDSFIQRIWLEDRNEVWWRVRLGDFTDVQEARRVRDELSGQFADIWVDNMRKDMVEKN
ncbi:MAG: SPOR domain-containing protein [Candidatus Marinimicrobia bacterium]|nr:SPOR domain-containing protein [Candidatus Neomarinimicrobiota bacterium]